MAYVILESCRFPRRLDAVLSLLLQDLGPVGKSEISLRTLEVRCFTRGSIISQKVPKLSSVSNAAVPGSYASQAAETYKALTHLTHFDIGFNESARVFCNSQCKGR